MSIQALDKSTIRNIHSGQVIVDIESIVKELVENALDAFATFIELKLIDHGLHCVQVKDNGRGIEENDRAYIAKHHYTSKIREFQDLESIDTFGFRGEALYSICSVSKCVSVTTKTKDDPIAKKYDLDSVGNLSGEQAINTIVDTGTIISVVQPFLHLPVRRQVAQKNASASAKRVQELLTKYALVYPSIRFALHETSQTAGKPVAWIKPPTPDVEAAVALIYGSKLSDMLERLIETDPTHTSLTVDILLPKKNSDPSVILKGSDRIFFYVNQRPINYVKSELKELVTIIRNRYREFLGLGEAVSTKKMPFIYVHVQLSPDEFDVNIEPNKTTILFHDKQRVVTLVESLLDKLYPSRIDSFFRPNLPNQADLQKKTTKQTGKENQLAINSMMNWNIRPSSEPSEKAFPPTKRPDNVSPSNTNPKSSSLNTRPPLGHLTNTSLGDLPVKKIQTTLPTLNTAQASGSTHLPPFKPVMPIHTSKLPEASSSEGSTKPASTSTRLPSFEPVVLTSTSNETFVPGSLSHLTSKQSIPLPKAATANMAEHRSTLNNTVYKHKAMPDPVASSSKSVSSLFEQRTQSPDKYISKAAFPSKSPCKPPASVPKPSTMDVSPNRTIPQKRVRPDSPTGTRDETDIIQVDMDTIRSNYARRKEQITRAYRMRIEDYIAIEIEGQEFVHFICHSDECLFFIRGRQTTGFHKVNQVGVLKYKEIRKHWIMDQLIRQYAFNCPSRLDRPVQVQFSMMDPLCGPLFSLACRERLVLDDSHGHSNVSFKEITDRRVTQNGFQVRWRKEPHLDRVIVQFTSIYPLGTGYGPADFRELLLNLDKRPSKILYYLESIAQDQLEQAHTIDEKRLEKLIDQFSWQTMTDSEWKLGVLDSTVMGCMLITK